ncbi:MAG: inositol monophosphatase family protein [Gammaproteobacteria bacterium]|jgi:histidinol-phosphatase
MAGSEKLEVALEAASAAAEVIRHYYGRRFAVRTKQDRSPVTDADVESEQAIRRVIAGHFPDHGFYGEETGRSDRESPWLWLVDPIDGTKGFVRGYPFFSTQIALMHEGDLVLGVSSAPVFGETAWAERGGGAWLDGEAVRVSAVRSLGEAAVSTGNLRTLALSERWSAWGDIVARVDRIRGYGDFYHYHLLAAGRIDAVIESDVNILDVAALSVIVTEAGGVFTDLAGRPPGLATTSVAAANPQLHPVLVEALDWASVRRADG